MFLERYGACATRGINRPHERESWIRAWELQMGYSTGASQQHMHQLIGDAQRGNDDGCNVGDKNWCEAKHPPLQASARYAGGSGSPKRSREQSEPTGSQPGKGVPYLWHRVCAKASTTRSGAWFVLLPGMQREIKIGQVSGNAFSPLLGWHGQKRGWIMRKMDEQDALAITIERLMA